jgi:hypothetical protein
MKHKPTRDIPDFSRRTKNGPHAGTHGAHGVSHGGDPTATEKHVSQAPVVPAAPKPHATNVKSGRRGQ